MPCAPICFNLHCLRLSAARGILAPLLIKNTLTPVERVVPYLPALHVEISSRRKIRFPQCSKVVRWVSRPLCTVVGTDYYSMSSSTTVITLLIRIGSVLWSLLSASSLTHNRSRTEPPEKYDARGLAWFSLSTAAAQRVKIQGLQPCLLLYKVLSVIYYLSKIQLRRNMPSGKYAWYLYTTAWMEDFSSFACVQHCS